jgi:hypothetical protein
VTDAYRQFLEQKIRLDHATGFDVAPEQIASLYPLLKPHQAAIVRWAVQGDPGYGGIHLTNYESVREGKINPGQFSVASLDEASILRSFGSKTYQEFLPLFNPVRFKFVATATPSPNRFKELIHYAGFLGIMDTGQALTRFFQRDSQKAGNLTLYPHKAQEFWLWLNSWAIFLQRPSDLGFSDDGYVLPELDARYHEVAVDHSGAGEDRDGQARLFRNSALGLSEAARSATPCRRAWRRPARSSRRILLTTSFSGTTSRMSGARSQKYFPRPSASTARRTWTSARRRSSTSATANSVCSARSHRLPEAAATCNGTVTARSSSASASASTRSFKAFTGSTGLCRPTRYASTSSTPSRSEKYSAPCSASGRSTTSWSKP